MHIFQSIIHYRDLPDFINRRKEVEHIHKKLKALSEKRFPKQEKSPLLGDIWDMRALYEPKFGHRAII